VESALSSAVGALYGTLHGGADEAALNEAIKVGSPAKAREYVLDLLANKGRLMGMGHREYKKLDPRAAILKPMAEGLCKGTDFENVFLTLKEIEKEFNAEMQKKGKEVWANLEFYKGPVNLAIGIPATYFTAGFAMARTCRLARALPGVAHRQQDHATKRPVHRFGHPLPLTAMPGIH